jgi:Cu(I)/Ag(I) efflux system membrane fusion protein
MRNATLSVLLLGVLGAGFLAGSWYRERESVSAANLRARKILYYVDPMHPAYRSNKPGIAPDCGMQLEPIYADGGQHPAAETPASSMVADGVRISPEKQQLIGVRVSPVEKKSGTERLRLYGRVAPDETRVYRINVGIDGFIREISTVTTGSHVRQDEWLATFSTPEARSPIQGYLVSVDVLDRSRKAGDSPAQIDLASASLQIAVDRLLTLGMSIVQIEEIGRTRRVPPTVKITAPADGFVLARNVSTGQKVERGNELYQIADLRRVWVVADVFGADAEVVQPGAIAEVSVPGRSASLRARVSSDVRPQFDAGGQSVKLRLEVDNPGFVLRPEMSVDVDMLVTLPRSIAVPVDAVLDSGLKKTVFVERSAGVFEPRQVETGWRFGQRVQIVKGLAAGDRVVVAGTFLLDAENRLRTARSAGSLR